MWEQAKQLQKGVQVSYYVANEWGYYHVTLPLLNQQIAVSGPAFRKILGIDYNVECGCRDITVQEAVDLGFIFPTNQR